jgi:hypothetical protein
MCLQGLKLLYVPSNNPSRNRTPQAAEKLRTKANATVITPNPRDIEGMNQPGPIHLHIIFEGISKTM